MTIEMMLERDSNRRGIRKHGHKWKGTVKSLEPDVLK